MLRLVLVGANVVLFTTIDGLSILAWRREKLPRNRALWMVLALAAAAIALGSLQRLVLQTSLSGGAPESVSILASLGWQVVQSVFVGALGVFSYITIRRAGKSIAETDCVAGVLLDRARCVNLDELNLTRREQQVLGEVGAGRLSDRDLAERLQISESTVQTHVKTILRKAKLNRRWDLVALAVLFERSRTAASPGLVRLFTKHG